MTAFWILAALLAGLAVAALLPALLRRRPAPGAEAGDDAVVAVYRERLAELEREHARGTLSDDDLAGAKADLEYELLAEVTPGRGRPAGSTRGTRASAVALAVLVPAAALLLYALTGAPGLVGTGERLGPEAVERYRAMAPEERVAALEPFLAEHPRAARAWSLLAGAYRELERHDDAVTAYARARASGADGEAWLVARQAEALLLANERRFDDEVRGLIEAALERDARNPLALMLAGHAALTAGDRQRAASYWRRLAETLPPDDERRALVEDLVARAEGDTEGAPDRPAAADAGVTVRVRLAQSLRARAEPDDTVFVLARGAGAADGPPLAVARTTVDALPAEITLGDADAMTPDARLSQADAVIVTARVARGGDAMAQSGDLEGESGRVAVGDGAAVEVTIDRLVE